MKSARVIEGFPQRLVKLRKANMFTASRVAEIAEIKLKTYLSYEEGRSMPSIATLIRLRIAYNYSSVEDLLGLQSNKRGDRHDKLIRQYLVASKETKSIIDFILKLK